MRSNLLVGISSAVAAVAVAGSAVAGTVVVDNFTVGSFSRSSGSEGYGSTDNAAIFALPGSNNTRSFGAFSSITATGTASQSISSTASGVANLSMSTTWGSFGFVSSQLDLAYGNWQGAPAGTAASSVDLTSFTALTIFGAGTASMTGVNQNTGDGSFRVFFQLRDNANQTYERSHRITAGALGNISFDLTAVTGISMSSIKSIWMQFGMQPYNFSGAGTGSASLNYDISSIQLVPAPGVAALVGVAGLITGRRRKA